MDVQNIKITRKPATIELPAFVARVPKSIPHPIIAPMEISMFPWAYTKIAAREIKRTVKIWLVKTRRLFGENSLPLVVN
jgi:hypothetical protein